jgi:hypothetical protein
MTSQRKITPAMAKKMRVMRQYGMEYEAIAAEFPVSLAAVWFAINGHPYKPHPRKQKIGSRQVYAIRRAYDLGRGTHKQRAERFGISERYAIKIAYRTRWGHLPEKGD